MFKRPLFEYLAIICIATGIMLSALLLTPTSLTAGLGLIFTGIAVLYLHYKQMGTSPELFS